MLQKEILCVLGETNFTVLQIGKQEIRVVKSMECFHYKARIRLTGSLHSGNERIGGKEGVIEVSELIYGTEIVNREKNPLSI